MTTLWEQPAERLREMRPDEFPARRAFASRWSDNDQYGHLNNAVHYQLFDSAINAWLLEAVSPSEEAGAAVAFVAESGCRYLCEVAFPAPLLVGIAVVHLGRSSVRYEPALFSGSERNAGPVALGRWVHVYVDAATRRPTPIPMAIRTALEGLRR